MQVEFPEEPARDQEIIKTFVDLVIEFIFGEIQYLNAVVSKQSLHYQCSHLTVHVIVLQIHFF